MGSALDTFGPHHRFKAAISRTMGKGAQVVRTPDEALARFRSSSSIDLRDEEFGSLDVVSYPSIESRTPSPTPIMWNSLASRSSPSLSRTNTPSKPKRAPPSVPIPDVPSSETIHLRSVSKGSTSPVKSSIIALPPLPSFRPISGFTTPQPSRPIPLMDPPPLFAPVLLAPCMNPEAPASQQLISLETASSTLTTTMQTLTAIPSRLSEYLLTLVPSSSSLSPPPSPTSPFSVAFHEHQEAVGLRASEIPSFRKNSTKSAQSIPPRMHIFLDRPSSPYNHVLAFLRSVTAAACARHSLPRGLLQMPGSTSVRMEALFELREEARYLGMVTLEKLCDEEIIRRQQNRNVGLARGGSRSSSDMTRVDSSRRHRHNPSVESTGSSNELHASAPSVPLAREETCDSTIPKSVEASLPTTSPLNISSKNHSVAAPLSKMISSGVLKHPTHAHSSSLHSSTSTTSPARPESDFFGTDHSPVPSALASRPRSKSANSRHAPTKDGRI